MRYLVSIKNKRHYSPASFSNRYSPAADSRVIQQALTEGREQCPSHGNPEFSQTQNKTSRELLALFKHFYIFVFQKHSLTAAAWTDHQLSHAKLKKNGLKYKRKHWRGWSLAYRNLKLCHILHFWLYCLLNFISGLSPSPPPINTAH